MKYKVIECGDAEDLSDEVNNSIKEGWKPLGGASIAQSESDDYRYFTIVQAMVMDD